MRETLAGYKKIELKNLGCGQTLDRLKEKAKLAIVAANKHYAGFGPATASSFRKMVGLKEVAWEDMKQKRL
jgi:hypothetical protein